MVSIHDKALNFLEEPLAKMVGNYQIIFADLYSSMIKLMKQFCTQSFLGILVHNLLCI